MSKGKYIVIEGHDGVGKTTQVELLSKYFRNNNREVIQISEPGGCLSGDMMRILVKNQEFGLDGVSNLLIFTANRRELWQKVIEPSLLEGKIVICDRNWWSSMAFQHFGQGVDLELVEDINKKCLPERYIKPDFGCIMTLPEKERAKRLEKRLGPINKDAFEGRSNSFQARVRNGYEQVAKLYNVPLISAATDIESIHRKLVSLISG